MKFVAILVSLFIASVDAKLRIKDPRATIQLGPHGDVSLTRSGPGRLEINANVAIKKGLRLESDTRINGVTLENLIRKLIAETLGIPFKPVYPKKKDDKGAKLDLGDLCKNISSAIPFRGTSTLEEAIKGILRQNYGLLPDKTIAENLAHFTVMILGKDLGGAIVSNPIDKLSPVDLKSTVGKGFTDLMRILLPGNITSHPFELVVKEALAPLPPMTVPDMVKLMVTQVLFNGSTAMMYSEPISKFLPLPIDTRNSLGETLNMLMQILPINSTWSLETGVTALLSILPIDTSMSLPDNINKRVLPLLLTKGNASDTLFTTAIARLLPVPLDTHKTLPGIMADILKLLPPPISAIPTATLLEIVTAVLPLMMPLPKDVTKILSDIIADTMLAILPGIKSMTLPDLVYPLAKAFFGNATLETSVDKLLSLPFDTTDTIPEVVDKLVKGLSLPLNVSATLAHNLEALLRVMPLDMKTPLSDMPKTLLSLFAGNSTDAILATSLGSLLPVPLDTSKSMAATIDALLPVLPLPLKNWTTDKLSDVAAQLLKVLPFDYSKALPEMITSLFRAIFPADKRIIKEKVCKYFNISVKARSVIGSHLAGRFRSDKAKPSVILADLEKAVKDGERTSLYYFCDEADKVVGELPHILDTKFTSLLPIDTTKTAPVAVAALLPFNKTSSVYDTYATMLPPDLDKYTVSEFLGSLMFPSPTPPAPPRVVALFPMRNGTNGTRGTKSSPAVAVPIAIDLTKPLSENIAMMMKMMPVHPQDLVKAAVGMFEVGMNTTKAIASMLPYNASMLDLVKLAPLPPNVTKDITKMVSVLPSNLTDAVAPAVASTVTAFKSDPDSLEVLSQLLASILPFELKPEAIYKTLNDLRSDRDFLPKVLSDLVPVDETKSLARALSIDKKSSAEIMAEILDDLSRCEIGPIEGMKLYGR